MTATAEARVSNKHLLLRSHKIETILQDGTLFALDVSVNTESGDTRKTWLNISAMSTAELFGWLGY